MHEALLVPDLIRDIVGHLSASKHEDRRALGALATVNRDFSEFALDRLWIRISPWAFEHVMSKDPVLQRYASITDITADALLRSRATFYSERVRALVFAFGSKSKYPTDVLILSLLQKAHRRLFPKLNDVEFDITELDASAAKCMHMAATMTSPNIRDMSFRIRQVSPATSAHFNPHFFRTLKSRCTGLVNLDVRLPQTLDSHIQETAKPLTHALVGGASHLRRVYLSRDVDLHDYLLVQKLAHLSELRYLDLGVPKIENRSPLLLKPGSFPKLETLRLDDMDDNAQLIRTILVQTTHLRDLKLRTYCKEKALDMLPRVAHDIGACTSLTKLRWRLSGADAIPASANIAKVCWSIFQPLQALLALESLHVSCVFPLQLSDAQILDLLSHWPHLCSWTHKNYADPHEDSATVSLRTLLHGLVCCPLVEELPLKLSSLDLPEDATLTQLEEMNHPFEHVLSMIEGVPDALAQNLQRVLPKTLTGRESPELTQNINLT